MDSASEGWANPYAHGGGDPGVHAIRGYEALSVLLGLTFGLAALVRSGEPGPVHTASLRCGTGVFTLSTRRWSGQAAPYAPLEPRLSVRNVAGDRSIPIELGKRLVVDGRGVRQGFINGWSCLRSSTGRSYVHRACACAIDRGYPGDCGGDREWFRFVDERGRRVDAGLPRQGRAQADLQRRLGLETTLANGVEMTEVLGD